MTSHLEAYYSDDGIGVKDLRNGKEVLPILSQVTITEKYVFF